MKVLKLILAVMAALVLAVMLFAWTLPGDVLIERKVTVNVPQGYAFDYLDSLKNWEDWTVWKDFDSTLVYSYSGKIVGKGAKQTWKGERTQEASLAFTKIYPPEKIEFELFWDDGRTSFSGYIATKRIDITQTEIHWVHYKNVGWNPFMRILGSMLEDAMGPNFEKSLANLKKQLELQYNIEHKKLNVATL
jgi:hypothetical protein